MVVCFNIFRLVTCTFTVFISVNVRKHICILNQQGFVQLTKQCSAICVLAGLNI